MVKFYKMKDSEIRRAFEVDEAGNKVRCIALIGQVKELIEKEIIFDTYQCAKGNMEKWLVIYPVSDEIEEQFDSLEEAKASINA